LSLPDRWVAPVALLGAVCFWGLVPPSTRHVLEALTPAQILLWRFGAAGLVVTVLLLVTRPRMPDRAHMPRAIALGLFGILGFNVPIAFGINIIKGGIAAMLIGMQPVIIAVLAAILLHEVITARMVAGLAMALGGCALIALAGGGEAAFSGRYLFGCFLVLLGATCYATYSVLAKPFLGERIPAASVVILGTYFAIPVVAPIGYAGFFQGLGDLSITGWLAALLLGVGASVCAPILFNFGLSLGQASRAGSFLYLIPLFGLMSSAVLLGEQFTLPAIVGGALIILGVVLATLNPGTLTRPGKAASPVAD
jgi:drug/metabolite transporter (DMT)-like permease